MVFRIGSKRYTLAIKPARRPIQNERSLHLPGEQSIPDGGLRSGPKRADVSQRVLTIGTSEDNDTGHD